ncbi:MAG: hypothetical protein HN945_11200 [Deltaproteobacteria bacterium]|nr:hypothetical protein [Deltaproteobacteria bacterium]
MDITKKQARRQKAKDFIKPASGSTKPSEPEAVQPAAASPKTSRDKKRVGYYLDKNLINQIQIQAAKNGEQPCHLIERAAKRELEG